MEEVSVGHLFLLEKRGEKAMIVADEDVKVSVRSDDGVMSIVTSCGAVLVVSCQAALLLMTR